MVSQKPWRIEPLLRLLAAMLVCFSTGMVVAAGLRGWLGGKEAERDMLPLIMSILCLHGAGLVASAWFVREHKLGWAEAFGLKHEPGWAVLLGVCVGIIALPVCWWLQAGMVKLLTQWGFPVDEQEAVRLLRLADSLWKQIVLGLFAIVLAPVAEETFFRGIVYPMLKRQFTGEGRAGSPRLAGHAGAILLTAVLFALVHGNVVVIIPLTALAVAMTLLYEWTNNLLACIVVHSLFNTANFVMLFVLKLNGELPVN